jgi:hypothetical protein
MLLIHLYSRPRLTVIVAAALLACAADAQADVPQSKPTKSAAAPRVVPRSQRGEMWYAARYGVDQMRVRYTASGASVEFRYRVVDPDKAAVLSDKHATPYMIDERTGIKLLVPVMEQIGALRQTVTPEQGREYWLLFANAGKVVKPGQRVDVSIGSFHARGLTVE